MINLYVVDAMRCDARGRDDELSTLSSHRYAPLTHYHCQKSKHFFIVGSATMTGKSLLLLFALASSPWTAGGAKVKRVRAGKVYSEHDPVHIVVNKVG